MTVLQGIKPDLSDLHQIREIRTTFAPYSHYIRTIFTRIRAYSRKGHSVFAQIRRYSHTFIPIHTCECAKRAPLDSRERERDRYIKPYSTGGLISDARCRYHCGGPHTTGALVHTILGVGDVGTGPKNRAEHSN